MSAKGYLFAELTVHDHEVFYHEYMGRVRPMLESWGANFLISTDSPEVIEGGRAVPRVILLEFSSLQKARDFYYSEEYQSIIKLRFDSSKAHLYIMEGRTG
ncbi:DUF1330 domain-containing protein [Pseudomonas fluorescens]|jgi:uncharacterized protein (DUF1330 family)|uniref:DUF1330 domain-containing protein n=1 Tax=Pseudomonas fluorescens TaxID=294 RepID=A0A5E7HYT7_PSEFL|nr:DUF1330 domain-containing protein [Pseudomonas fluorescens]VVO69218.1 hypothetical protein PS880_01215 [Pseudomonas fluorescens]